MAERARIAQYFAPLTQGEPGSLNLTDDTAILTPPAGMQLAVTTDSVIENIHVLPGATPQQFAQKLMRRNLSDLAAMGALPWRYLLNLHTPHGLGDDWLDGFSRALAAEQAQFGIVLVGGDSTSAPATPIHATITCFGLLASGALLRSTARAGDDIYVSGTIGDAALGLRLLQGGMPTHAGDNALIARYHLPEPRLALGSALHGIATAAIDISDGLLADLGQLCTASRTGAEVMRDAIPRSPALAQHLSQDEALWAAILNGGDDYELCFTAPAAARAQLAVLADTLGIPLTRIGRMVEPSGMTLRDSSGAALAAPPGWEHG